MIGAILSTLAILIGLALAGWWAGGVGVFLLIVCMVAGALIAGAKGERPIHGAGISAILGPIGVLILACLPRRRDPAA